MDLVIIWAGLIAFAVLAYILLDGFDLGVGLLFPWLSDDEKDLAMTSVAPVWDGNETWLVLGGGGLLAVFPLAYAVLLPALYAPVIGMLLGLVLRGVAFEFRWRTRRRRYLWDWAFTAGSLLAAVCQGIMLGALIQGIPVENRAYAGGWWTWLSPFSLFTGAALVVGYVLLGATWLVMKTDDRLQARCRRIAEIVAPGTVALIGVASAWTALLLPQYQERWFAWPAMLYSLPVPAVVLAVSVWLVASLKSGRDRAPFLAAQCLFLLSYVGLCVSFYPDLVPPDISIYAAAAPDSSLAFLLAGAVVLIPMIVGYTVFAYWVFRGKVDAQSGYH